MNPLVRRTQQSRKSPAEIFTPQTPNQRLYTRVQRDNAAVVEDVQRLSGQTPDVIPRWLQLLVDSRVWPEFDIRDYPVTSDEFRRLQSNLSAPIAPGQTVEQLLRGLQPGQVRAAIAALRQQGATVSILPRPPPVLQRVQLPPPPVSQNAQPAPIIRRAAATPVQPRAPLTLPDLLSPGDLQLNFRPAALDTSSIDALLPPSFPPVDRARRQPHRYTADPRLAPDQQESRDYGLIQGFEEKLGIQSDGEAPDPTGAARVDALLDQLREQDNEVKINPLGTKAWGKLEEIRQLPLLETDDVTLPNANRLLTQVQRANNRKDGISVPIKAWRGAQNDTVKLADQLRIQPGESLDEVWTAWLTNRLQYYLRPAGLELEGQKNRNSRPAYQRLRDQLAPQDLRIAGWGLKPPGPTIKSAYAKFQMN